MRTLLEGGASTMAGMMEGALDDPFFFSSWYMVALDTYPLTTKAITTGLLNLLGDLICQLLVDKVAKLDVWRSCVFTFLGFAYFGPALHFWYFFLSQMITLPGASGALLRLLFDQACFSPLLFSVFLCILLSLEGRAAQIKPAFRKEFLPLMLAAWQFWVPLQFFNFWFVPQKLQVLYGSIVALAWNVILSLKSHKDVHDHEELK